MSDSQLPDYLQIAKSFLANRRQWQQSNEMAFLTLKSITHLLQQYGLSFEEHKTLINEQSLKIKELELRIGAKASKKDVETQVANYFKNNSFQKREDDCLSEYDKLKDSREERERVVGTNIEEMKTISELITEKKMDKYQKDIRKEVQFLISNQRLELEERISSLKEDLKNKFLQNERQRRQLKQKLNQCRHLQTQLQSSHNKSQNSVNEQKINFLEHSNKRINDSLNQIISHIETNYMNKDQISKMIGKSKEKGKSPIKPKSKQESKHKKLKDEELEVNRFVENALIKVKEKDYRQWSEFKQNIMKDMGQMVKVETVNNLIDSFQKDILERYQGLSSTIHKLQTKINKNQQNNKDKQIYTKSQKRPQKRSSPNKSIQIQNSIIKLEKTILDRQAIEYGRIQSEVDDKIKKYDNKIMSQLNRRQKYLCQTIEQTYNQYKVEVTNGKGQDKFDMKASLKMLYQTNLFCRYIYTGIKKCKKDEQIVWEKEVVNNLKQDYAWNKQVILIHSGGLYRLEIGIFFAEVDLEAIVLINKEPICNIKSSEVQIIGQKFRGRCLNQLFLLPAKSRLTVRVNQQFYGQVYLAIQKL